MMSQPSLQTIAVYIIPNVSQSKYSQAMKFVWPINRVQQENIFLQKLYGKWGKETSPRPLFIFYKSLIWSESKWSTA